MSEVNSDPNNVRRLTISKTKDVDTVKATPLEPDGVWKPFQIPKIFKDLAKSPFFVDKSDLLVQLVIKNESVMFVRPRRMGKTTVARMVAALFEKNARMTTFKNMKVQCMWQEWWQEMPVLWLDFSKIGKKKDEGPEKRLTMYLKREVCKYDSSNAWGKCQDESVTGLAEFLITNLAKSSPCGQCVVIIDEYDIVMLDQMGKSEYITWRDTLKEFFATMKSLQGDGNIAFMFLTGISYLTFNDTGSGSNDIRNLTTFQEFGTLCGITQSELESIFKDPIEQIAKYYKIGVQHCKDLIHMHYNGYKFSGNTESVYSPWCLRELFYEGGLGKHYWENSGNPTYLMEMLQDFRDIFAFASSSTIDLTQPVLFKDGKFATKYDAVRMLFYKGYLTLHKHCKRMGQALLVVPNMDASSFCTKLLVQTVGHCDVSENQIIGYSKQLMDFIVSKQFDQFAQTLKSILASIPFNMSQGMTDKERYYQSLLFLLLIGPHLLCFVTAEEQSNKGRLDILVVHHKKEWANIFEIKMVRTDSQYEKTAHEAFQQIQEKNYSNTPVLGGIAQDRINHVAVVLNSSLKNIGFLKVKDGSGKFSLHFDSRNMGTSGRIAVYSSSRTVLSTIKSARSSSMVVPPSSSKTRVCLRVSRKKTAAKRILNESTTTDTDLSSTSDFESASKQQRNDKQ